MTVSGPALKKGQMPYLRSQMPTYRHYAPTKFSHGFETAYSKITEYVSNPFAASVYWGNVWKDDSTHYYMYGTDSLNIFVQTSADGLTWGAPSQILTKGGAGTWDVNTDYICIVWKESSTYYMLFGGFAADGVAKVGLATSATPDSGWSKNAGNPVFTNSTMIGGTGAEPTGVIKVGSTYYMWFNNFGPTTPRVTGLATSTDLLTWTQDPANPIFKDNRFGTWIFKWNGKYYALVTHYCLAAGGYSSFELYSCDTPTFYPNDRTFLGVVRFTPRDATSWTGKDADTPAVLMTDIGQDWGSSAATFPVYYAGKSQANVWLSGMFNMDSSVLNDGNIIYDAFALGNTATALVTRSTDYAVGGTYSLKIAPSGSTTEEEVSFHHGIPRGKVEFDALDTGNGVVNFWLYDSLLQEVFFYEHNSRYVYWYNALTNCNTNITQRRTYNAWYHVQIWWNSYKNMWGWKLWDANGVLYDMRDNILTGKYSGKVPYYLFISRAAAAVGTFYIDNIAFSEMI